MQNVTEKRTARQKHGRNQPTQSLLLRFSSEEHTLLENAANARSKALEDWAKETLLASLEFENATEQETIQKPRRIRHLPARKKYGIYGAIFASWLLVLFVGTRNTGDRGWWGSWQAWDAEHYKTIATQGYVPEQKALMGMPPGFPVVAGATAKILHVDFYVAATVMNLAAFLAAAILIGEWFCRRFSIPRYAAFVFVLASPMSYFALSAYSDVLFMVMLWGSIWLALLPVQTRTTVVAQVCLMLCMPWIRLAGYALASWAFVRKYAGLTVLISLGAWMGFNQLMRGDPFYFKKAQEEFGIPMGGFFSGLVATWNSFLNFPNPGDLQYWAQFNFLPLFYLFALVATAAWLFWKRQPLLAITTLSLLYISHNYTFWRSSLRYDLPLMPLLCLPILCNIGARKRTTQIILWSTFCVFTAAQWALQLYFARALHRGEWAY